MCPGFDSWFRRFMLVDFIAASPFRAPRGFPPQGTVLRIFLLLQVPIRSR